MRAKRERLEAWKKERDAKKALDEAKVKAMALAGKTAPGESILVAALHYQISHHLILSAQLPRPRMEQPARSSTALLLLALV